MLTIIILLFYIWQNHVIFMGSLSLYPIKKYFVILLDLRKLECKAGCCSGSSSSTTASRQGIEMTVLLQASCSLSVSTEILVCKPYCNTVCPPLKVSPMLKYPHVRRRVKSTWGEHFAAFLHLNSSGMKMIQPCVVQDSHVCVCYPVCDTVHSSVAMDVAFARKLTRQSGLTCLNAEGASISCTQSRNAL